MSKSARSADKVRFSDEVGNPFFVYELPETGVIVRSNTMHERSCSGIYDHLRSIRCKNDVKTGIAACIFA